MCSSWNWECLCLGTNLHEKYCMLIANKADRRVIWQILKLSKCAFSAVKEKFNMTFYKMIGNRIRLEKKDD